jgi:hypothetical protein
MHDSANAAPTKWLGRVFARTRAAPTFVGRFGAALGVLALIGARPDAAPAGTHAPSPLVACSDAITALRPALYTIPLLADQGTSGSGVATLVPAPSPFGITVTPDGHPIFTVTVTAQGLAAPSAQGGTQYIAWATTQELTEADKIGVVSNDKKAIGTVSWNKYIVLVTAEGATVGDHWKGPVVLRGFSPATYLANYASHPLFLGGMPPC